MQFRVTIGDAIAAKEAMSLKNRRRPSAVTQNKIPSDPPPPCKTDRKHGPSVPGRKDQLCANCGKFADRQLKLKAATAARRAAQG